MDRREAVRRLAERFGMNAKQLGVELASLEAATENLGCDIDRDLNRAQVRTLLKSMRVHTLHLRNHLDPHGQAVTRPRSRSVQGHAAKLESALDRMPLSVEMALQGAFEALESIAWADAGSRIDALRGILRTELDSEFADLRVLLTTLAQGIDEALDELNDFAKPKGLAASGLKNRAFVLGVRNIWLWQTGRRASYTTDPESSERQGRFIEFMTAVAELFGLDPAPLPELFRRRYHDLYPQERTCSEESHLGAEQVRALIRQLPSDP